MSESKPDSATKDVAEKAEKAEKVKTAAKVRKSKSPRTQGAKSKSTQTGSRQRRRRTVAIVGAVIAGLLAVLITRAVWQGRSALAAGDELAADGKLDRAVQKWSRAARWYVPLAPHVGDALDRLREAGTASEEAGDPVTALIAWRGVRSSVMATRSFYTPNRDRLAEANDKIATLMAALEGAEADPTRDEPERAAWHLALLKRPVGPSVGFSLLAIFGFVLWIGAAFWFAWSAIDENDRLIKPIAVRSAALILIGLLLWLLGLNFA